MMCVQKDILLVTYPLRHTSLGMYILSRLALAVEFFFIGKMPFLKHPMCSRLTLRATFLRVRCRGAHRWRWWTRPASVEARPSSHGPSWPDQTKNVGQKTTTFWLCFHSIQKPPKRVKTHKNNFLISVFCCPNLGVVKDNKNNFGGIMEKNFVTDLIIFPCQGLEAKENFFQQKVVVWPKLPGGWREVLDFV